MWMTQSAAQAGRGHRVSGVSCQDKTMTMCRDGVTAIALADGAGSARLSHEGASCAVEAACEVLCLWFAVHGISNQRRKVPSERKCYPGICGEYDSVQ